MQDAAATDHPLVPGTFPYEIQQFGPAQAVHLPANDLASRGEAVVYLALVKLVGVGAFLVNVHWGDVEYTPGPDERSAEFVIPALDLAILVNSRFTHPDPEEDRLAEQLIGMLGYRVEWIWDYEILPEMGGNVWDRLAKVPGLMAFGSAVRRKSDAGLRKRTYSQPFEIIATGGRFQAFAIPQNKGGKLTKLGHAAAKFADPRNGRKLQ